MSPKTERPIGQTNSCVQKQRRSIPWFWEGVLATGAVTLLSAPEKIGKTTLLSLLLDRLRAGGELLGRTVWPGKTILCSEESSQLWASASRRLISARTSSFMNRRVRSPRVAVGGASLTMFLN